MLFMYTCARKNMSFVEFALKYEIEIMLCNMGGNVYRLWEVLILPLMTMF